MFFWGLKGGERQRFAFLKAPGFYNLEIVLIHQLSFSRVAIMYLWGTQDVMH